MSKIWVVLPAYNEEGALAALLDSLSETLIEEKKDYKILVVNDGSTDRTPQILEEYSKKLPVLPIHNDGNKGLAETIRRGLFEAAQMAAPKDIIITMDADNTHPAGLMLRMERLIKEGNDVVIASRYREGSYIRGLTMFRRFLSFGASWLFRIFFPTPGVRDYTCGFRAYRVQVLQNLIKRHGHEFVTERGFSCMVDILLRLRMGRDVVFTEVPMVLRYDQKVSQSKMKVAQTIMDTLKLLVRRRIGGT